MKYKIERVKYPDSSKSSWWRIVMYKNGMRWDESPHQYSSFFYTLKLWIKATILYT